MYLTYYVHLAGIKRSDCMLPLFSAFGLHDSDLDPVVFVCLLAYPDVYKFFTIETFSSF